MDRKGNFNKYIIIILGFSLARRATSMDPYSHKKKTTHKPNENCEKLLLHLFIISTWYKHLLHCLIT